MDVGLVLDVLLVDLVGSNSLGVVSERVRKISSKEVSRGSKRKKGELEGREEAGERRERTVWREAG